MIRIILCDDDAFTLSMLAELIETRIAKIRIDAEILCKASTSGEVISFIDKNPGEYLVFLDLDMGKNEINGLDFAQILRDKYSSSKIVFVTSHLERSMDILKSGVEPFGFVEKVFNLHILGNELERYLKLYLQRGVCSNDKTENTITLQIGIDEFIEVPVERISYVESVKSLAHNICYHTIDESQITVRDTIAHAQELLGKDFILSHRSTLVNTRCVLGLEDGQLKLSNGQIVPCAISKRKLFSKLKIGEQK